MSTSTPKNVPSTTPSGPKGTPSSAGSMGATGTNGAASTDGAEPPARVYVKLPSVPAGGGVRVPRETSNALFQWAGIVFAALLCISVPAAPAIIMALLLREPGTARHGLLWLWIAMFAIIEPIAILVAWGVWREFTGWTSPRDYAR